MCIEKRDTFLNITFVYLQSQLKLTKQSSIYCYRKNSKFNDAILDRQIALYFDRVVQSMNCVKSVILIKKTPSFVYTQKHTLIFDARDTCNREDNAGSVRG